METHSRRVTDGLRNPPVTKGLGGTYRGEINRTETMELPHDIKSALDEKVFVHIGTLNPDGSPQVSVVWITRRGDTVLFSTAEGRVKPRNIAHDPRVALSFSPPDNTSKNVTMQGRVTKIAAGGTWLIDELASKYVGHDSYQFAKPGEVRVNYEVEIDRISTWG